MSLQKILQFRRAVRRYLATHPALNKGVMAFGYTLITALLLPASALAGERATFVVFAKIKPTCGLVNLIRPDVENITNDVIGLATLYPIFIIVGLVLAFFVIFTEIGQKLMAYSVKLAAGLIVIGIAPALMEIWFQVRCGG